MIKEGDLGKVYEKNVYNNKGVFFIFFFF